VHLVGYETLYFAMFAAYGFAVYLCQKCMLWLMCGTVPCLSQPVSVLHSPRTGKSLIFVTEAMFSTQHVHINILYVYRFCGLEVVLQVPSVAAVCSHICQH
jgi:hypothetical protein